MTNLPPPEPPSSRIGLDELVSIIVALTTIGTILIVALNHQEKGLNSKRLPNSLANHQTTPGAGEPTPLTPVPKVSLQNMPSPEAKAIASAPSPAPVASLPAGTPNQVPSVMPLVAIPSSPKSAAPPVKKPAPTLTTGKFADVPQDLWARPYIESLATRGIMTGFPDGSFRPDSTVTRAEFAILLQKAFPQKPKSPGQNFKDVKPDFWASPAIQETTKIGFLRGYPGNIFQPNQKISRAQVLVALVSGLGLTPTPGSQELSQIYQDAGTIPKYAKKPVSAATMAGLVVNYPNPELLNPNQNANRAEVAAIVYQALVAAGKVEAIPSRYVVKF